MNTPVKAIMSKSNTIFGPLKHVNIYVKSVNSNIMLICMLHVNSI